CARSTDVPTRPMLYVAVTEPQPVPMTCGHALPAAVAIGANGCSARPSVGRNDQYVLCNVTVTMSPRCACTVVPSAFSSSETVPAELCTVGFSALPLLPHPVADVRVATVNATAATRNVKPTCRSLRDVHRGVVHDERRL